jgi:hypothetical protein
MALFLRLPESGAVVASLGVSISPYPLKDTRKHRKREQPEKRDDN